MDCVSWRLATEMLEVAEMILLLSAAIGRLVGIEGMVCMTVSSLPDEWSGLEFKHIKPTLILM